MQPRSQFEHSNSAGGRPPTNGSIAEKPLGILMMTQKPKKDRKPAHPSEPRKPIAEVTQKTIRDADPEQRTNTSDRTQIRDQNPQKQGYSK